MKKKKYRSQEYGLSFLLSFFFLLYLFFSHSLISNTENIDSINGEVSLKNCTFKGDKTYILSGKWKFSFDSYNLLDTHNFETIENYQDIYEPWNSLKQYPTYGRAIYSCKITGLKNKNVGMKITRVHEHCKVYINKRLVFENRKNKNGDYSYFTKVIELPNEDTVFVNLFIENYSQINPGIVKKISLDKIDKISDKVRLTDISRFVSFGATVMLGIYFIFLFLGRRRDKPELFLGIYNLVMGLRSIITANVDILYVLPNVSISQIIILNQLMFIIAVPMFIYFLQSAFPEENNSKITRLNFLISLILLILIVVLPNEYNGILRNFLYLYVLIFSYYTMRILVKAIKNKRIGSGIIFNGFIILLFGIINDMLRQKGIVDTSEILPVALIFFIIYEALYFSTINTFKLTIIEKLYNETFKLNKAFHKFVPNEFLKYLDKKSILDVELGSYKEHQMTVMFIDIRGFTSLSEKMTPNDNFKFLNNYLKLISPSIYSNGGFIDKYIGDGVMVLFPNEVEKSMRASIDIMNKITMFNIERKKSGYQPITIGIGIHCGRMILGTIGNDSRMETTVISDAVNVASRLEQLSKNYKESIIISEDIYKNITNLSEFNIVDLDKVTLRGKVKSIQIYGINY